MSSRRGKNNGGQYVTRAECGQAMNPILQEISTVKDALVGKDLRGGLVKEVTELKGQLKAVIDRNNQMVQEQKEQKQTNFRLKMAVLSFGFTLVGILLNHFLH